MSIRREVRLLRHGRDWRGRSTVPRSAEPHVVEPEEKVFPTAWARTPVAVAARSVLRKGLLKPVAWRQITPVIEGAEYLDGVRGPVVFIANHSSHLDTPLILGSLPERFANRVAVGAASDYFFDVRWRATLTAVFFNAFPVERYGSKRLRSLALDLVDDGWSLLLYPEGTRSEDGWMNPFKLGAAVLCVTKGIPCVPIAIRGSYAAMPRGRNWPQPGKPRVTVRYGRPLVPEEGEDVRAFRTRMAKAVNMLAAEEDLGWYDALRAAADDRLEIPGGSQPTRPGAVRDEGKDEGEKAAETADWRRIWASTEPLSGRRRRVWRD
ncbi:lysophospholipid acyltransferase family protein [Actinoallomurus sp. NPDC050550]|uniref:lysophospholipid acyltransferase family protein n=1 Tax=Actinoallomurus sp. NPDC050550 TaxID=3154937 RepID=UPI0033DCB875